MSQKNIIHSRIKNLKTFFSKDQGVRQAMLFGSYARGNQNPNSDIDIAIQLASPMSPEQSWNI